MGRSSFRGRPAPDFWSILKSRDAIQFVLKIAAIIVGGVWALSPVLQSDWTGDDPLYLTMNPIMYDPNRLWKAWFEPGSFIDYYPIEQTVQWYQWHLWGIDNSPFPYLVCNLVLHLTSALLIWHLFDKLGLKLAWLGGLIFAIFPLMVDSIGVSSELKNTLSLPPFLLAMSAYLDFEKLRTSRSYLLALGLFLIAMLCKLTMDFFPFIILLQAWWKRGRITWADLLASIPFFIISLVLGLLIFHSGAIYDKANHYVSPGPIHLGGLLHRFALFGLCVAFYFGHCFLPLNPTPFYRLWPLDPLTPMHFLPWLGITLVLACCWMKRHSWGRPVLFALAFFVLGLAPFLGFLQVSYMCLGWVFDHLLYIPIIALIGLVVAGIEDILQKLPRRLVTPAIAVVTIMLALLGFQTRAYATLFADQVQLWRYNLEYTPDLWFVHYNYAEALAKKDANEAAIAEVEESLRLNPDYDMGYLTLGADLFKVGKYPEAIDAFNDCLRVNPRFGEAHLFLGIVHMRMARLSEAIDEFHNVLRLAPHSMEAHLGLAQALAMSHRVPEAIVEMERAQQFATGTDIGTIQQQLDALKKLPVDGTPSK